MPVTASPQWTPTSRARSGQPPSRFIRSTLAHFQAGRGPRKSAAARRAAGSADLLVEAADEPRGVGTGVAVIQRSDGEGEEAGGIEAGPFGQQAGERTQEHGGADEEGSRP